MMPKYIKAFCISVAVLLFAAACRKMDQELAIRNKESGIIRVKDISAEAPNAASYSARVGDTVDVVVKIGLAEAPVSLYLGMQELPVISRTRASDTVLDLYTKAISAILPVEHLIARVPADFPIGVSSFSLHVNGLAKPAFGYTIIKPILLYPGKVLMGPTFRTPEKSYGLSTGYVGYYNPFTIVDGPFGKATSSKVMDVAVDKNNGSLYFLDQSTLDSSMEENAQREGAFYLRKLEAGTVTTLGGNGEDPEAANIRNRKLSKVASMKIGPDGMLYMAVEDDVPPSAEGANYYTTVPKVSIIKVDPASGNITDLIGSAAKRDVMGSRQGFADGKADTALIYSPRAIDFDKAGNLWFADNGLLRELTTDGMVKTVMGRWSTLSFPYTTQGGETVDYIIYQVENSGHIDGFYGEAQLGNLTGLAIAGNGKIYMIESGGGNYQSSIREVNPDTREISTIIGLPLGVSTLSWTGTFKEIDLSNHYLASIDVDYDGNILYSTNDYGGDGGIIYKMDLTSETVSLIAGGFRNARDCTLTTSLPGAKGYFFYPHRIVFDQTGKLYVADDIGSRGNTIKTITLER